MTVRQFARIVVSGCGIGLIIPFAAGTVASLFAVLIGAGLMRASLGVCRGWALWLAAVAATLGGLWAVRAADAIDDPGWVVIDEFAGQWIALLALRSETPRGLAAAFLLFRFFDIAKPGPIGWADRRHSAFGVVADDVLAGAAAALVLWLAETASPHLLG